MIVKQNTKEKQVNIWYQTVVLCQGEHLQTQKMFRPSCFTGGILQRLQMRRLNGCGSCYHQGHDDGAFFFLSLSFFKLHFIKWYISPNVPERKGVGWGWERFESTWANTVGEAADGRTHKSENIAFPDQRLRAASITFFSILYSRYFPPYLSYLSPFKKKNQPVCFIRFQ